MCILHTEGSEFTISLEAEIQQELPTGFHEGGGPVVEALNSAQDESEVRTILTKWADSQKKPD
jgi:hypothetical protein